jgi:uncharacterized OB-fold protein
MTEGLPLPIVDDPIDAAYWEAARRGQLVVQRCGRYGRRRFPPRPMCPNCQSSDHEWPRVSGEGRIWSFVIPHPPLFPALAKLAPYDVVLVELSEGPSIRAVGNLVNSAGGEINEIDAGSIKIGAPVRVVFDRVTEEVPLPRWVLAEP